MNKTLHWLAVAAFTLAATVAQAASGQKELVDRYIKVFSTEPAHIQKDAAQDLEWLGLSDTRLFDLIEKNLKAHYQSVDKVTVDYAAWMAKALGFSGNDKYRATLETVVAGAGHKNLKKHAGTALENLAQYQRWNPIIAGNGQAIGGLSIEHTGYVNMLNSGDRDLQRIAAKRIYHERLRSKQILDVLFAQAQQGVANPGAGKEDADAVAHMLKALAATSDPAYRPLVEDAANNATDKNLRKWAAKYLKSYYGI